ncbi:hypothetical protein ABKN59_004785 [Abortiporus biennis]
MCSASILALQNSIAIKSSSVEHRTVKITTGSWMEDIKGLTSCMMGNRVDDPSTFPIKPVRTWPGACFLRGALRRTFTRDTGVYLVVWLVPETRERTWKEPQADELSAMNAET